MTKARQSNIIMLAGRAFAAAIDHAANADEVAGLVFANDAADCAHAGGAGGFYSVAMSMTKRYLTSLFSMRS